MRTIQVLIALLLLTGCNGWQDSMTGPSGVGERLQETNDKIVGKMGLEKGSDTPSLFSPDWFLERFHEFGGDKTEKQNPSELSRSER